MSKNYLNETTFGGLLKCQHFQKQKPQVAQLFLGLMTLVGALFTVAAVLLFIAIRRVKSLKNSYPFYFMATAATEILTFVLWCFVMIVVSLGWLEDQPSLGVKKASYYAFLHSAKFAGILDSLAAWFLSFAFLESNWELTLPNSHYYIKKLKLRKIGITVAFFVIICSKVYGFFEFDLVKISPPPNCTDVYPRILRKPSSFYQKNPSVYKLFMAISFFACFVAPVVIWLTAFIQRPKHEQICKERTKIFVILAMFIFIVDCIGFIITFSFKGFISKPNKKWTKEERVTLWVHSIASQIIVILNELMLIFLVITLLCLHKQIRQSFISLCKSILCCQWTGICRASEENYTTMTAGKQELEKLEEQSTGTENTENEKFYCDE